MPSLVLLYPDGRGRHFPLFHPITSLGRDDTCTVQLTDDQVSRRHLQLRLDTATGKHLAADDRSANGVFINGRAISAETPLCDGDQIRIGRTTLMYLAGDHPDAESALVAASNKGPVKRPR